MVAGIGSFKAAFAEKVKKTRRMFRNPQTNV